MHSPPFIYQFIRCWTVHPHFSVNDITMNMGVQIYLQDPAFNSFQYIPRSGVVGLHDNSILNFFEELLYCFS